MAVASRSFSPRLTGLKFVEISREPRSGAPFAVRISTNGHHGISIRNDPELPVSEGPSCIFVGPIETARQETLEALYRQARYAYYNGEPLIVDDMFDRVELKLRWYGSKSVQKYPRCSIRRQSTYADAEADLSQVLALASVWLLIFAFGGSICLIPALHTVDLAYEDAMGTRFVFSDQSVAEPLNMLNSVLFMILGSVVGYPILSASGPNRMHTPVVITYPTPVQMWYPSSSSLHAARALQRLWKNDLIALKGSCPNCGEEVFAFVRSDQCHSSPHRANCHVCESLLEFRTKVEPSISGLERGWIHGRVYLVSQRGRNRFRRWM